MGPTETNEAYPNVTEPIGTLSEASGMIKPQPEVKETTKFQPEVAASEIVETSEPVQEVAEPEHEIAIAGKSEPGLPIREPEVVETVKLQPEISEIFEPESKVIELEPEVAESAQPELPIEEPSKMK